MEKKSCMLPLVAPRVFKEALSPQRERLIRYIDKKWVNSTVLHFWFQENNPYKGAEKQKDAVRKAWKEWKNLGIGLEFKEVSAASEAEIRIGFQPGSSWSYVGRDCIDLDIPSDEPTMNLGWDLTDEYGYDTALHEIGHALGFPHEHQNPNAGIQWDEEKVYRTFAAPPNSWERNTTFYNIIRKIPARDVSGSDWDKDSIMHYAFPKGLILVPEEYKTKPLIPAAGLSEVDIAEVKKFYPEAEQNEAEELQPFLSRLLSLQPGEQKDYVVRPRESRWYTMASFGPLDSVMVLFEEQDGEPVYLAGNDDSGSSENARIEYRLLKGKTYFLRLRLYSASGDGGIMVW
jgi:hypothetical protein